MVAPGQQPLGQRAPRDDHAVLGLRVGQQVTLGCPLDEAVLDLVAEDRGAQRGLRGPPAVQRVVAHPHLADQPDPLQGAHPAHGRGVPDHRVRLVDLVQVQVAGAEPVRAGHRALLHHRGQRQHREDLGGQEHRVQVLAQGLAQDPLAAAEPVDLGGVEEGHAQVQGAPHDRVRLLLGVRVPVSPLPGAELPGAQADLGNLLGGAGGQIAHGPSLRHAAAARRRRAECRPRTSPATVSPGAVFRRHGVHRHGSPEGCSPGPVFPGCRGPVGTGA